MSGFLSNLTAKTLGSANLVRPRVPALFEAARNDLPVLRSDDYFEKPEGRAAAVSTTSSTKMDPNSALGHSSIASSPVLQRVDSKNSLSAVQSAHDPSTNVPVGTQPAPAPQVAPLTPPPGAASRDHPLADRPQSDAAVLEASRGISATVQTPKQSAESTFNDLASSTRPIAPRSIGAEDARTPDVLPRRQGSLALPDALSTDRKTAPATQHHAPRFGPESLQRPLIRVTIGRIEVRAVSEPAVAVGAAPRAAGKGPRVSLSEYLRARSTNESR